MIELMNYKINVCLSHQFTWSTIFKNVKMSFNTFYVHYCDFRDFSPHTKDTLVEKIHQWSHVWADCSVLEWCNSNFKWQTMFFKIIKFEKMPPPNWQFFSKFLAKDNKTKTLKCNKWLPGNKNLYHSLSCWAGGFTPLWLRVVRQNWNY